MLIISLHFILLPLVCLWTIATHALPRAGWPQFENH